MKNGTDAKEPIEHNPQDDLRNRLARERGEAPKASVDSRVPERQISTTALINNLIQTLDAQQFLDELKELDFVTQRQCLMRALREVAGAGAIRLHGSRLIRQSIRALKDYQKGL